MTEAEVLRPVAVANDDVAQESNLLLPASRGRSGGEWIRSSLDLYVRFGFVLFCVATLLVPQAGAQIGPPPASVPKNSPRFAAAIRAFFSGAASGVPARVCAVGDSTTFGVGSQAAGTGGLNVYSWPSQLALALNNYGVPAHQDGAIGDDGGAQTLANDNRWTIGSSWTQLTGAESVGGAQLVSSTTTNALTFAPTNNVDTFRFFYVAGPAAGSISYAIDGGAATTVSEAGAAGLASLTVSAGTPGTHSISFKYVSGGPVNIQGVEGYNTAFPGVSIVNAGWPGSTSANWAVTTNPQSPGNAAPWSVLGCTTAVLNLGINDEQSANGISQAQFVANLEAIIGAIQSAGADVIVVIPNPIATSVTNQATQLTYMNAAKQAAAAMGAPVVSLYDKWITQQNMQNSGLDYDNLHPSRTGYGDEAELIANALVPPGYAHNLFGQMWSSQPVLNQYSYIGLGSALSSASGAPDASITRNGSNIIALGNGTRGDASATLQVQGVQFNKSGQSCKTAAYTMATNDNFVCVNAASAAVAITLPACGSGTYGQDYFVEKTDNSGNAVTIGNTTDTVNGASGTSAVSLSSQYQVTHLRCQTSATWYRLQ